MVHPDIFLKVVVFNDAKSDVVKDDVKLDEMRMMLNRLLSR